MKHVLFFFALVLLPLFSSAQDFSFHVGTNEVQLVFNDVLATPESKSLFYSDFTKIATASENGLSIMVVTNKWHPASMYPPESKTSTFLFGMEEPKFTNGDVGFPSSLVRTNDHWTLPVSKHYTDAYAQLCTFESGHSNEIAKLRAFISNDLASDRLALLSDDDFYEMYLSRQWEPGNRSGPSALPIEDRPQILRGVYYQPPIAAVMSWPMGPSDSSEHLWAQINVRVDDRVYETRAIYFRDRWWLTIWDWETGAPVWTP